MGSETCFLIYVLYGTGLLDCALKIPNNYFKGDVLEFPMEPENRAQIHALLPLHVRSCGPIVEIKRIFEVHKVRG